ncbi:hypothetical protein KXD40_000163 [Peronospora effusa]|uniref:Uncharacterized protein n=1 Tax=Peronospora effusa TaxID=542832 RepID=A0A3M6VHK6_9STRA|nr:hypothetical protein DD238_001250 [Peronospora effusa]UIZ20742.1 hypothetical protein KXD40_000163 [Peronospora effusa]
MLCSRFVSAMTKSSLASATFFPSITIQKPIINWLVTDGTPIAMELLNRNARRPKKANHGKRPCSHHRRRQKRLGAKKA